MYHVKIQHKLHANNTQYISKQTNINLCIYIFLGCAAQTENYEIHSPKQHLRKEKIICKGWRWKLPISMG